MNSYAPSADSTAASMDVSTASTSLLTDMYELTMLQGALASGAASRRSVFELFGRRLPGSRRFGVVAGTGRLLDAIEALYREFGYYRNALCSFAFEGESGMHTMQELMKKLRANAPEDIAGYKVESVVDYDTDGTGLPRANVLEYHLDGGHKLMVRPSGTEPKIKVYLSAVGDSEAAADAVNAALAKAAADMMKA